MLFLFSGVSYFFGSDVAGGVERWSHCCHVRLIEQIAAAFGSFAPTHKEQYERPINTLVKYVIISFVVL